MRTFVPTCHGLGLPEQHPSGGSVRGYTRGATKPSRIIHKSRRNTQLSARRCSAAAKYDTLANDKAEPRLQYARADGQGLGLCVTGPSPGVSQLPLIYGGLRTLVHHDAALFQSQPTCSGHAPGHRQPGPK